MGSLLSQGDGRSLGWPHMGSGVLSVITLPFGAGGLQGRVLQNVDAKREEGQGHRQENLRRSRASYHRLSRRRCCCKGSSSIFVSAKGCLGFMDNILLPLYLLSCSKVNSWWARAVRQTELPLAAPTDWRRSRWWRTVQALSEVGEPHPHKKWVRGAEAPVLAWAGDEAHELAESRDLSG